MLGKGDSIIVFGRTFWVRGNGYTVSSAEIFINGECAGKVDDDGGGGSGNQFLCQAHKWLIDKGHLPPLERHNGSHAPLWRVCEDLEIKLAYSSAAVKNRGEL